MAAQRDGFCGAMQARLVEAQERHDRNRDERKRREVGEPGRRPASEHTASERARRERSAFDQPDAADPRLVLVTHARLLEDRVVDDAVDGARVEREVHAEDHRRGDVGRHVPAEAAE